MADLDNLTYEDAQAIVSENLSEDAAVNKLFVDGDHWQDQDGWIGPMPAENESNAETVWEQIENGFISKNAINEILSRHADSVISQEPDWSLTVRRSLKENVPDPKNPGEKVKEKPNEAEQMLIDEGTAALVDWWDRRKILREIRRALRVALSGERACVRLYVPDGLAVADASGVLVAPRGTLPESFERLFIQVIEPSRAAIEPDPDTQMDVGAFVFSEKPGLGNAVPEPQNLAELHYLDKQKRAVIRRVGDGVNERMTLDLNGRLAFHELELDPFITAPIRSNQKLLNMALTMLARNSVLGGFLERVMLNAVMPGTFVDDPDNEGKKIFQPSVYQTGAGASNVIMGAPIYGDSQDRTKVTGYTSPSIVYRDPVAVDTFIATKKEAYQNILEEAHQLFVLISGDATSSGESRKQAERDFQRSLRATVTAMNDMGRWLLEAALAMAAGFSGQAAAFKQLRAVFACNVDAEQLSSADIQDTINLKKEKIISTETAMARVRVDDPDAEMAKIEAETPEPVAIDPTKPLDPVVKGAAA